MIFDGFEPEFRVNPLRRSGADPGLGRKDDICIFLERDQSCEVYARE